MKTKSNGLTQTQRRLNSLNTSETIANTDLAITAFPSPMLYYSPRPFYCDLLFRKWQHALNIDWNVYTFNTVPRKLFNHVSTFSVFFFLFSFFYISKADRGCDAYVVSHKIKLQVRCGLLNTGFWLMKRVG